MKKIIKKIYNLLGYIYCYIKGVKIGKNVQFLGIPYIKNEGEIIIGDKVILHSHKKSYHAMMYHGVKLVTKCKKAKIIIGNESRINGCCISAKGKIIIGKKVLIAANTSIIDTNGHKINNRMIEDEPKEIIISNNVWIGLNSIILKGTNIEENSIISACSVINGHINKNLIITNKDYHEKRIIK